MNRRGIEMPFAGNRSRHLVTLMLAATALLAGACKRKEASVSTAEANADFPPGCLETNPQPQIADACMACLKRNKIQGPLNDGCCGIKDSVGQQLCQAVSTCMRAGGAPVVRCNLGGDTTTCFCGKHAAECDITGKADGPCVTQIAAAAGRNIETRATDTPTAAQILDRYGQVNYALGRASNIAAIAGALCKDDCALEM